MPVLAAKALNGRDNVVCSFDRDFDRVPGLRRVEPG
jgi:predicted nucleic acid-binding protein